MGSTGRLFLISISIALFGALPAHAVHVGVYQDQAGTECRIQAPPPMGTTHAYVVVKFNPGMTGTQFKIAWPPCSPYALTSWSVPAGLISVGDPLTGIQISPGGCAVGDFVALQLDLQRIADPTGCCPLRLLPHPESVTGEVEIVDCAQPPGHFVAASASAAWLTGNGELCAPPVPPPSNPSPPDGAAIASIDVVLNAELHDAEFNSCMQLHDDGDYLIIYFGTSPRPPRIPSPYSLYLPYLVRGLAPATTYYWQLAFYPVGGGTGISPVWSFTTEGTTPARMSTWGAVKALYR